MIFRSLLRAGAILLSMPLYAVAQMAGTVAQDKAPYTLSVGVDEVQVTFHAADQRSLPVTNLTSNDFKILDNGKLPLRLLHFEHLGSLPIRAGILFDTSRSMLETLSQNRQIASLYASRLLLRGTDQAFVMRFDSDSRVIQDWTDNPDALLAKIQHVADDRASRLGGTKLYDSLYIACRDQWPPAAPVATGNFLLLFTDGLDNASHARIDDVIDICQERRTAIYVISGGTKSRFDDGQKILQELAAKTGGSVSFVETPAQVAQALAEIRDRLRDQYRITYKPRTIQRDGKFHKLKFDCFQLCQTIAAPSGYYAPH